MPSVWSGTINSFFSVNTLKSNSFMFRKLNGATDERLPHDLPGWNRRSLFYIILLFLLCFSWFPEENYPKLTFNQLVNNQDRIDRLEQDQPL